MSVDRALADLPSRYAGPGGAVAVLRDGVVLARHAWGYANAERRSPFTPATLFRVCSITKQFTCATLLATCPDPTALDDAIRARLPLLSRPPSALHLCHNQSGLRDYWALAMLHGSGAEAAFGGVEASMVIGGAASTMFAPGTAYSYCNQNFRLLSDALEARTGQSFARLLRTRVFDPAGMPSAFLAADTRAMPDGTEGYEGSVATGFRAAENRILWTGDAGLGASLDDMIAWEQHIDATRDDERSLPARLAAPVTFADGTTAQYGFGLGRRTELGRAVIGHGGALRGWRSHRLYVPAERVSVVVLFNHMADAQAAAMGLLSALLGTEPPSAEGPHPAPDWLGAYIDAETGLAARISTADGKVRLRYGQAPELLDIQADGSAGRTGTRLWQEGGVLWMDRPLEHRRVRLDPSEGPIALGVAGRFQCAELGAELLVEDAGGVLYGAFAGRLGQGRMEMLAAIGPDLWALPCPRALDVAPPGDWTLRFARDAAGRVERVQVGCWLARGLDYRRIG